MPRLCEIFEVEYGNKFDLNKMALVEDAPAGVNFVGRSSRNHGISARVQEIDGIPPHERGLITVALGGTKLLSAFVQDAPFYTAQNVAVLRARERMGFRMKVYYCMCIRHNRFRYSAFGREANRTIKDLEVPTLAQVPDWVNAADIKDISAYRAPAIKRSLPDRIDARSWKAFRLSELFEIKKGKRLTKSKMTRGNVPFIGAVDKNNGISAYIGQPPIHPGKTITVNYNGSVAEAFYQPCPFWCSDDVNVLYPKFNLTPEVALFIVTLIRKEKYRYSYGRKWHLERMQESEIRLPAGRDHKPDWELITSYVRALPYSSQLLPP